jgi:hypothetical protein
METGDIIFYSIAILAAFLLWRLLVVGWRKNWSQPHEIKDLENFGRKGGFNGIRMYGGDPEIVSRVEKELKNAANEPNNNHNIN